VADPWFELNPWVGNEQTAERLAAVAQLLGLGQCDCFALGRDGRGSRGGERIEARRNPFWGQSSTLPGLLRPVGRPWAVGRPVRGT
jgi:hypothetical protein